MVREMRRALEALKSGDSQGYRKIFDATYDEVYCRSFLITQKEEAALEFVKSFFGELFGKLVEADDAQSQAEWLWRKYYEQMKKEYRKLLAGQEKGTQPAGQTKTLAEIPSAFPLLHRIMLTMYYKDDFSVSEISEIFRLEEAKVQEELNKMEKLLPALVKGQPESVSGYLGGWKVLLLGASGQILNTSSDECMDKIYEEAAAAAGIVTAAPRKKKDDFEYFVADVELSDMEIGKSRTSKADVEPDEEDDDELDDEEDDDIEDEDMDDDMDDDEDEDDEDDDDDRYDWDLEDDNRKMVILGVVLALIIVAVIGFAAWKLLGKGDGAGTEPVPSEETIGEENDAELIIRGDGPEEESEESEEAEEEPQEEAEEPQEEEAPEEESSESETLTMKVVPNSVNVRSEANTNCDILASVKSGEKVEVLGDPSEEWVQIRCIEQNSQEGYVKSEFLTAVE